VTTKSGRHKGGEKTVSPMENITDFATGNTPWRQPGINYKKNELWLDVIEQINLIVSHQGTVLRSDVEGTIEIKSQLSGMPQLVLGLNDKLQLEKEAKSSGINLDDFTFHQCVRLSRFDSDRVISFVPPDGVFTLMKYRSTQRITLPFRILSQVKQISATKLDYEVSVISEFEASYSGQKVCIKIPTPPNTAVCKIAGGKGLGNAKYKSESGAILWKLRSFSGQIEVTLRASVDLVVTAGTAKVWDRPPISMEFEVPNFTASGLKITYLDVADPPNYPHQKWNKTTTKAGSYERRI